MRPKSPARPLNGNIASSSGWRRMTVTWCSFWERTTASSAIKEELTGAAPEELRALSWSKRRADGRTVPVAGDAASTPGQFVCPGHERNLWNPEMKTGRPSANRPEEKSGPTGRRRVCGAQAFCRRQNPWRRGNSVALSIKNYRNSERKRDGRWPSRFVSGAGDEARTRYLHLGKVALYQMSYTCKRRIIL